MNLGASASPHDRRRDTLTAKRIFAGFGCLGLLFVLWLLSTPVHQIYWATQARLFEAKNAVFTPVPPGDQLYHVVSRTKRSQCKAQLYLVYTPLCAW